MGLWSRGDRGNASPSRRQVVGVASPTERLCGVTGPHGGGVAVVVSCRATQVMHLILLGVEDNGAGPDEEIQT